MRLLKCALLFILLSSCGSQWKKNNNATNDNIRAIRVSRLFPIVENNGKLIMYDPNESEIYYYNNQILYKNSYTFNTNGKSGELLKTEKRFNYLVYTTGNRYGYFYDSNLHIYDKQILVDSMLKKEWHGSDILSSVFTKANILFITSSKNENLGNLEKKYTFRSKADTTQSGTIILSYTNTLKDIEYSLSKELDSIKNMKLYKIKIINNSRYLKDYNITVDEVEQNREIEAIPISNRTEILSFFERAKKNSPGN